MEGNHPSGDGPPALPHKPGVVAIHSFTLNFKARSLNQEYMHEQFKKNKSKSLILNSMFVTLQLLILLNYIYEAILGYP